jgi:putative protein-disulfide isomerase
MQHTLYYIHDPMCSWCYAFAPVWAQLRAALPRSVSVEYLLGGLAPDNHTPMEAAMRERLQQTWQHIEHSVPGTRFNFDFWHRCTPYRSTYPSCRAVIAAAAQGGEYGELMLRAIQHAYYQQARNPSELETLIEIACEIGLERDTFSRAIASAETEQVLQQQINYAAELGADSYPSLILSVGGSRWPIAIDYNDANPMLEIITLLLDE